MSSPHASAESAPKGAIGDRLARPTFSVVVATYNRAGSLVRSVQSLLRQTLSPNLYEIIIVDNNSTDGTSELAHRFTQSRPNIRCVRETSQGLSHARNRGWREAHGEYVAFIDDDAVAPEDWLECALSCFRTIQPQPQTVGGPVHPLFLGRKPKWAWATYWMLARDDTARFLRPKEYFYGSNMIFQSQLLALAGGFDPRVGMSGDTLFFSEEKVFFDTLWDRLGEEASFYYSPRVRVFHTVAPARTTVGYSVRYAFASGQTTAQRQMGTVPWISRLSLLPGLSKDLLLELWGVIRDSRHASGVRYWTAHDLTRAITRLSVVLWAVGVRPTLRRK